LDFSPFSTVPPRLAIFRLKAKLFLVEIRHYLAASGNDPYQQWLDDLKDLKGRVVVQRRIDRLKAGNFGDHKFCQEGVWELKIDFGPGYRVFYAQEVKTVILLLCGGSKRTQPADVKEAVIYWRDYQRRKA
jgi:putative addiction module killer protein